MGHPRAPRVASGLFLVSNIAFSLMSMRRYRTDGLRFQQNGLNYSIWTCALASAAVDAANVIGLGGIHAFSLYLGSVLLGLTCTGLLFLWVAIEIFRIENE